MAAGLKSGIIKIYDVRTQKPMIELDQFKGSGEVNSIAFSNKGLYFAAAWKNS
jgi:WD40 repeat protein